MGFDFSRLRHADRVIGASAIALFIFMFFFDWYGYSSNATTISGVSVGGTSASFSGWHTFTNSRWIWLITIIVALVAVAAAAGMFNLDSPVSLEAVVTGLGGLSTLLIFYRIVHHPTASASIGSFHASVGIKVGIWLGLVAAIGITYGGYLAMRAQDSAPGLASEPSDTDLGGPAPAQTPVSTPAPAGSTEPAGGSPVAPVAPESAPQEPEPPGAASA
jgi:hypothetical protein